MIVNQLDLADHVNFDNKIIAITHSLPQGFNASYGEILDILEGFFDFETLPRFKEMRKQFGHHE